VFRSLIAFFMSDRNLRSIGGSGDVFDVNDRMHRVRRRVFDLNCIILKSVETVYARQLKCFVAQASVSWKLWWKRCDGSNCKGDLPYGVIIFIFIFIFNQFSDRAE
jgi:hypothetical protein